MACIGQTSITSAASNEPVVLLLPSWLPLPVLQHLFVLRQTQPELTHSVTIPTAASRSDEKTPNANIEPNKKDDQQQKLRGTVRRALSLIALNLVPHDSQLTHPGKAASLVAVQQDTVILGLEPVDGVLLGDLVAEADLAADALPAGDAATRAGEDDEKVHSVNSSAGVVFDSQVDVLVDAKPEASRVAKVDRLQLVLLHREPALDQLHGLLTADGDVACNLLITADTELADGEPGLGEDGLLAGELLQHLGGTREPVAGLTDRAVDNEFVNKDVLLPVGSALLRHGANE